jgi:hypothetical protein
MGIAQKLLDGYKNTYDALVDAGYGKPATRRLPYDEYGIILSQDVAAGGGPQTISIASYGANSLGLDLGEFVHITLGQADEEYVGIIDAHPAAQTFMATFTKDHSTGATVRPIIIDHVIVARFFRMAGESGGAAGYPTLINAALREYLDGNAPMEIGAPQPSLGRLH